jgi:Co/Zn/Cd efflux system component
MNAHCHHHHHEATGTLDASYRRVLWVVLVLNAAMIVVEVGAGMAAESLSLQADAIDFFADAVTYAVTLAVLGASTHWRAGVAVGKAGAMALFGAWLLVEAAMRTTGGTTPEPNVMGVVGAAALAVNVGAAVLLFRHRGGDANRRSVWLCSRNDAIGNVAILIAAGGVGWTGSHWPDLVVGAAMAGLALHSAAIVLRQAWHEWRQPRIKPALPHAV